VENLEIGILTVKCQEFYYSQGSVREKNLVRESGLKLFILAAYLHPFLTAEFVHFILVLDHTLLHFYPHD